MLYKWAKELNRHFSKEDVEMANKLNIIRHQGNAKQNHMRYRFTPASMAIIKKSVLARMWKN